jgi:hypothetical protein
MKLETLYIDLLESKQTESQGLSILNKSNIKDANSVIKDFAEKDNSTNQKNIPLMAFFYSKGNANTELIISVANEYWELEKLRKLPGYRLEKGNILIGNKSFSDFIKFSEYIHAETNKNIVRQSFSVSKDFKTNVKPMWSGNGIDIYEGDSVEKCINYTQGGLTGKSYSFCIGQPGPQNMYISYRDLMNTTFYFIIDRNRFKKNEDGTLDLSDPLHIVVFSDSGFEDIRDIELTDANNTTGIISEFGIDVDKYIKYLKSKDVPVEKLTNKPLTEKEEEEEKLVGKENKDLNWFKELSYENKFNYIGRGHLLTDDQFDFLYDEGDDFLISKYVDRDLSIPEYQLNKLTKGQKNSYFRKRMISNNFLEYYEIKLLTDDQLKIYADKIFERYNKPGTFIPGKFLEHMIDPQIPNKLREYLIDKSLNTKKRGIIKKLYFYASYDQKKRYIEQIMKEELRFEEELYKITPDELKKFYIEQLFMNLDNKYSIISFGTFYYKYSPDFLKKFYENLLVKYGFNISDLKEKIPRFMQENTNKNFNKNSPIIEDLRKMKNLISYNSKT